MHIRSLLVACVVLSVSAAAAGAQTLRELRANFPGQSGRHPCLSASPTAVSAPFTVTGPGTLVIQDWLMPVRNPRVADSNGGAGLFLPGLRRLSGQLTQISFSMRSPDPMIDGQPGYSETHRIVGQNSRYEDVTIRIEPYTFGMDCIQFAQVRQVIVSFYPAGIAPPRTGRAEIDAGFAAIASGAPVGPAPQTAPTTPPGDFANSCQWANDGECDDPTVPGHHTSACAPGTDTNDCNRMLADPGNGCRWAHDGECDDPTVPGHITSACAPGTDNADCGR